MSGLPQADVWMYLVFPCWTCLETWRAVRTRSCLVPHGETERTACGLGMKRKLSEHSPFVSLWLPAAPLLFLAVALALKVEWFPSNTTDILQIINNSTFQPSSRYFRRAFLSRNPKCFSRLSSGSWEEEEEAHECVFLEAGTGLGSLFPALWVTMARTRGVFVHMRPRACSPTPFIL